MSASNARSHPDLSNELKALKKAIALERKAYYTDLQGKKTIFSLFVRRTSAKLSSTYPCENTWLTIRGLMRYYSQLDVSSRINTLRQVEKLLLDIETKLKTDSAENSSQARLNDLKVEAVTYIETNMSIKPGPELAGKLPLNLNISNDLTVNPKLLTDSENSFVAESMPKKTNDLELVIEGHSENSSYRQNQTKKNLETALETGKAALSNLADKNKASQLNGINNSNESILNREVKFIKGVGPKNSELFSNLGITNIGQLIKHYPRHHIDFQERKNIKDLQEKEFATIIGIIASSTAFTSPKSNISILTVNIKDLTGTIPYVRFVGGKSNKYLLERMKSQYPKDALIMISGMVELDKMRHKLCFKTAQIEILSNPSASNYGLLYDLNLANLVTDNIHVGRIVPVYSLTEGLNLKYFRQVMFSALELVNKTLIDPIPDFILKELDLVDYNTAIGQIHFPPNPESFVKARDRLVFDELFGLQLKLFKKRQDQKHVTKDVSFKYYKQGLTDELIKSLPFKLTNAQIRVFNEIALDMASSKPMYRLIQGDVGSGKTVVSLLAQLIAIESGYQTALMAPTEILAEQHYRQFQQLVLPLGLKVALLVGKLTPKQKNLIKQDLLNGLIHIVVGTQALLEDDIEFNNLGLIVIDEQHRFGVKQRARLKSKAKYPELLTMTATPIPRTLALTLHGDLDISEIDELPPNRKPVETRIVAYSQKKQMYDFIGKQIIAGRQAYIVFPLIEESETISAKAATKEYEILKSKIFPNFKLGLMHGKLLPAVKDEIMTAFRQKDIDILVSTTVIEVGVDVPNASIMVIENANRFGLAQLHQLRGRVGRGSNQSYCFLMGDSSNEIAQARLDIMTKSNDGFVIAQKDLEIRGPGEFLGIRQSGLPDLLLTDLVRDSEILTKARLIAARLFNEDPSLSKYPKLAHLLDQAQSLEEVDNLQSG